MHHVVKTLQQLCIHPGFILNINEMMKLFKGQNAQMVDMKNKLSKRVFKFFVFSHTKECYAWNFIPSRLLEGNKVINVALNFPLP